MTAWLGKAESDTLEFKRAFWTQDAKGRLELAKDIAALANHRGGTIVVGVNEQQGVASSWSEAELPRDPEQRILQAIERHWWPTEARSVLAGIQQGAEPGVLEIKVAGWPHGVVCVRSGNTLAEHRFPVRHGAHTREMAMGEVLSRYSAASRRQALRFGAWAAEYPKLAVYWQSAVYLETQGKRIRVPTEPMPGPWAELSKVGDDSFEVRIVRTRYMQHIAHAATQAIDSARALRLGAAMLHEDIWTDRSGPLPLVVPYEVVRSAWIVRSPQGAQLHLLLDVDLVLGTNGWRLRA